MFIKRTSFVGLVVVLAASTAVAEKETTLDAPIKRVTVFPDRAQVTRVSEIELESGSQMVVIKDLPGGILGETFRASVNGPEGIIITGLSHSSEHHLTTPEERVAALERELEELERDVKRKVTDRLQTFRQLSEFVAALSGGATDQMARQVRQGGLDVAQWTEAFAFVGEKSHALSDSIRVAQGELATVDRRIRKVRAELSKQSTVDRRTTWNVRVGLELPAGGAVKLTLQYIITGARWTSIYDARIGDDPDTVQFKYYAEVSQKTGEDWIGVDLTLSTARPSLGAGPGELSPWYLAELVTYRPSLDDAISVRGNHDILDKFVVDSRVSYGEEGIIQRPVQTVDAPLENVAGIQTTAEGEVFARGGRAGKVAYIVDGTPIGDPLGGRGTGANMSLVSGSINYSGAYPSAYVIRRPETILSGGQAVRVTVAEWTFKGDTKLIARPRNRPGAYRSVTLTNQDEAPLMPGQVAIFAGTHFLGNSRLWELIAPGEEFELPFGLDNQVTAERKVLGYKKSYKGDKIRIKQTIEITLHNYSSVARLVEVAETLPVTQDGRIKVKIGDMKPEPGKVDDYGNASWDIDLGADEEVIITIPIQITHPKSLAVTGF
jgi:hypothetical protein